MLCRNKFVRQTLYTKIIYNHKRNLLCITLFFNISFKYLVKKYSILC